MIMNLLLYFDGINSHGYIWVIYSPTFIGIASRASEVTLRSMGDIEPLTPSDAYMRQ